MNRKKNIISLIFSSREATTELYLLFTESHNGRGKPHGGDESTEEEAAWWWRCQGCSNCPLHTPLVWGCRREELGLPAGEAAAGAAGGRSLGWG
jgi:hypothetical protein